MIRRFLVVYTVSVSMALSGCAQPSAPPAEADKDRSPSGASESGEPTVPQQTAWTSSGVPSEEEYRAGRPKALMDYLFRHRQTEIPPPGAPFVELDLTELMVDDEVLRAIGSLPDLETLLLGGTNFDDSGAPLLSGLSRLKLLGLRRTLITDGALLYLAELPTLRAVYLSDTPLTDSGIAHLAKIDGLQQLGLKNTDVTSQGLARLQGLSSLERLWLDSTTMDDESVSLIARWFPRLRVLSVGHTSVTDAGVREIARLSDLAVLSLEGTTVTDESVPVLGAMGQLTRIQLMDTALSPAGLETLAAQRPDLKIFTDNTLIGQADQPQPPPGNSQEH